MRDGAEEHLSVGHSVGDRSHIIEKKRNKEGRVKQNQRFVNINEGLRTEYCHMKMACLLADAEQFNNEFKSNAMNFFSRPQDRQAAIESNKERNPGPRQRVDPTPIVTIPDDEDETP
jgi:hypothetical protein